MVFNDVTTKQGLIQDCEMILFNEYGKITGNSDLLHHFTHLLNRQYDKAFSIIIECDGRWQYGTGIIDADLVSGQRNYTLDLEHAKITKVRLKDEAGNYKTLIPIDQTDAGYSALYNGSETGQPVWYDKDGDQLILLPTPSYSQLASIEMTMQQVPDYFEYTDTNVSAGIAPQHHRFLSFGASLDYAIVNSHALKNDLAELYRDERERMVQFHRMRNRDEGHFLRAINRSTR